ncbi:unnamed protein product [Adineta steineri]|uniref:Choline/ethanolamine kinase n=3 Tax=Adineta steineri TaxID=433720 RepID=A0A818IGT8_9BILA|nr:unnamed protein product [Adineta steineri]
MKTGWSWSGVRLLLRKSVMPQEKITSNQALQWCQTFLRGAWSTITVEQMHIDRVPGALSNYIYCCTLPDNIQTENNEPRKVLLKIYGEAHAKHRGTLLIDSIVCALLSERKIGPYVHGIFPEGRIEDFIEAESLNPSDLNNEDISRKLGGLLGELHQTDMPLAKEPVWFSRTIEQYLSDLPTYIDKLRTEHDREIFKEIQSVCNFKEEFEQLKNLLSTIDSPVCFTHNDFHAGNILRLKSQPDNYTVIDFEYCSYNYRGYDIGNYFSELMFDYKSATEWPFFNVDFTLYPNENQQMIFITSYIDSSIQSRNKNNSSPNAMMNGSNSNEIDGSDRNELARQIMKEANYFALASHFFWTLWALNMAASTTIKFGYMEFARARLTAYHLQRDILTGTHDKEDIQIPPQIDEKLLRSPKNPFYQSYSKTND